MKGLWRGLHGPQFRRGLGLTAFVIGLPQVSHAWIIDFDNLAPGTVVTTQYSEHVTFSSSAGNENYAVAHAQAVDPPNLLGSGASGTPTYLADTYMDFAVALVDFDIGTINLNNASGLLGRARVFENGVFTRTLDIIAPPDPGPFAFQVLGADNMTRIELVDLASPLAWDSVFANVVPEPTAITAIAVGSLWLLSRSRRRKG